MTSITKLGVASIVGAIMAPAYLVKTQWYDASESIPEQVDNAHEFLTRYGYHEKKEEDLVDFSGTRDEWSGGNFALGCHKLIFGGKNVPKLEDLASKTSISLPNQNPREDYFGDDKQPTLGCATAAILNSSKGTNGKVYEFELALKRGNRGFLERITVWDSMAMSQLVFLNKNEDYSTRNQHPWVGIDGIQRTVYNWPETKNWDYLVLNETSSQNPKYFVVWVSDEKSQENSKNKGIFEGLETKFTYNKKPFSSIVGTDSDANWGFNYYGHNKEKLSPNETYGTRIKSSYTSKIASEISNLKGSWKDVKEFCNSQQGIKDKSLSGNDVQRLRDYCYIDQTQYSASLNRQT